MMDSDDDYAFDNATAQYSSKSKARRRGRRGERREPIAAAWGWGGGLHALGWLSRLRALQRGVGDRPRAGFAGRWCCHMKRRVPAWRCADPLRWAGVLNSMPSRLLGASPLRTRMGRPGTRACGLVHARAPPPSPGAGPVRHPEARGAGAAAAARHHGGFVHPRAERGRRGARAAAVQVVRTPPAAPGCWWLPGVDGADSRRCVCRSLAGCAATPGDPMQPAAAC